MCVLNLLCIWWKTGLSYFGTSTESWIACVRKGSPTPHVDRYIDYFEKSHIFMVYVQTTVTIKSKLISKRGLKYHSHQKAFPVLYNATSSTECIKYLFTFTWKRFTDSQIAETVAHPDDIEISQLKRKTLSTDFLLISRALNVAGQSLNWKMLLGR